MSKEDYVKTGIISTNSRGVGYVSVEEGGRRGKTKEKDIEIENPDLGTALNGDTVEIMVSKKNGRLYGRVLKVVKRAKENFSGTVLKDDDGFYLKPADRKIHIDITIPRQYLGGAKEGDKVFVSMIPWTNRKKNPEGKVVKIFGRAGEHEAEMQSIALERGFAEEHPDKILEEAKEIKKKGLGVKDFTGRRDFRDVLTFTIDPIDAKDFDDAISFRELTGGKYEVGVHIADVSYYVREGSAIDQEARERGTSVYLVDRTIPMLPEILSNDLCSLVPNQDRLVLSAVFELDKNGRIFKEWFGEAVIHSKKRFSYEEAYETIKDKNKPLHRELSIVNNIAKNLTRDRIKSGALSLEESEVRFVLDKSGRPIRVIRKERTEANKLIEEFMLLANRRVAELMGKKNKNVKAFVYRIHDAPSKDRMEDLTYFLKSLGYKVVLRHGVIPPTEINAILRIISGKNEEGAVSRAIIRSMAKAIYSTENIGHYGLAFPHYTHFTSPIRRYPDLLVHRILKAYLNGKKIGVEKLKEYKKISLSSSEREKYATEAERESVKFKQVEYMGERVGETFNGVITGVSEAGLYVEEKETRSEGLIRLRDLNDDYYILNEKRLEILGQRKKKSYRFGDEIRIKVRGVDLERKTIDYVLA